MKDKELYASPESEVMEIRLESMIAASPDVSGSTIGTPFGFTPDEIEW